MSLIENERIKLLATALNNGAVGTFVAGVVAPTFLLVTNERAPISLAARVQFFWNFYRYITTSACEKSSRRSEGMSWTELYAFFGAPAVLGLTGLLAYWWHLRQLQ